MIEEDGNEAGTINVVGPLTINSSQSEIILVEPMLIHPHQPEEHSACAYAERCYYDTFQLYKLLVKAL